MTLLSAFQHMQYTKFNITIDMPKLSLSFWLQLIRNDVRAETFIRCIWLHIICKTDGAKSMDIIPSVSSIVTARTINAWKIDCLGVFGSHGMSSPWQLCYELAWKLQVLLYETGGIWRQWICMPCNFAVMQRHSDAERSCNYWRYADVTVGVHDV